tara:strand:+ start:111 stop:284 length:174 start_codon:yes stop_codon:yes gene_type:complete
MTLTIEIKNVYGNDLIYPVCDTAKKLCSITGYKTFNTNTIETLKEIGYVFKTDSINL